MHSLAQKWRLVLLVMLIIAVPMASAQASNLLSKDLYALRSVGDVQLSPDATKIAYTIIYRDQPGRPYSRLWIYDLKTNQASSYAGNDGRASHARWSPNGNWLAFFGSNEDRFGLMVARPDGSELTFLAEVNGTNHPLPSAGEEICWSPDSKRIAFISAAPGPESDEADGDPVVITRYLYKPTAAEGHTRFNDNRRTHIFVADVAGKQVSQLTEGIFYEHSIDWSPDGQEILFVSNREPNPDTFFNYDIFSLSVGNGTIRKITNTASAEYQPQWSPDGQTIAFLGTKRGLTSSETTLEDTHVWLMRADGSERRELGASIDNRQGAVDWAPDGKSLIFTVQQRGSIALYSLPVASGQPEMLVGETGRVRAWTAKGNLIAYNFEAEGALGDLYVKEGRDFRKLASLNEPTFSTKPVSKIEAFTFLSFDGLEVEAFLTKPASLTGESKHPLIVMIKGGPHSQQGPTYNHKAQVYASHGWATLMVNYRGSIGYGQAFADAIFQDQNGGEAKDVLYGTQAALRRYPWLDAERIGIEGGSYGGQLTNWLITQTNLYKAAIPIAGISNLISFNYMAYYHDYLAVEFGAFPHQDNLMDVLWDRSPLKHVAKVRTPTMLVHGENDNDVPIAEAEQFYIALHDVGVEAVMVRYPREGHGVRETAHVVDLIDRSVAWYKKHFYGESLVSPTSQLR